jgi:L,D-transpeptidase ErfK/SrfK
MTRTSYTRRHLLTLAGAALATPSILSAQEINTDDYRASGSTGPVDRNASAFRRVDWREHFDTLGPATLIADIQSRALHYWDATGTDHRIYPTSVPLTEELTKRGYTSVIRKREGPDWTPTASMVERNPDLRYMPPGPDNPLGTHAMYLDWPAYLIHGTHDTRKIGRPSSDGCIGLYNEKIEELFAVTPVGAQVLLL